MKSFHSLYKLICISMLLMKTYSLHKCIILANDIFFTAFVPIVPYKTPFKKIHIPTDTDPSLEDATTGNNNNNNKNQ